MITLRDLRRSPMRVPCASLTRTMRRWTAGELDRLIGRFGARADAFGVAFILAREAEPPPAQKPEESRGGAEETSEKNDSGPADSAGEREPENDEGVSASGNPRPANAVAGSAWEDGDEPRPRETQADGAGCESMAGDPDPASAELDGEQPAGDAGEDERGDAQADSDREGASERADTPGPGTRAGDSDTCAPGRGGAVPADSTADGSAVREAPHDHPGENHVDSSKSTERDAPSPSDADMVERADAKDSGSRALAIDARLPIASYGGDCASEWNALRRVARRRRDQVREVERALRRLISKIDLGGLDETPRLDGRRLVREFVSRRCALPRAVRREGTLPLVVLACDVSGSCAAVCDETLAAALAIAQDLPHVLVVRHSNGIVFDAVGPVPVRGERGAPAEHEQGAPGLANFVLALGRPVAGVVAWADGDGASEYRALCEAGAAFYWLDSYCSTHAPRSASRTFREIAKGWRVQPRGWWQGVSSAASTAAALREMARGG